MCQQRCDLVEGAVETRGQVSLIDLCLTISTCELTINKSLTAFVLRYYMRKLYAQSNVVTVKTVEDASAS